MITLGGTFKACESCDQTKEHDHAQRNVRRPKDVLFARSV
jgi:hypothetical protein